MRRGSMSSLLVIILNPFDKERDDIPFIRIFRIGFNCFVFLGGLNDSFLFFRDVNLFLAEIIKGL
jgi:hypothetical protein